MSTYDSICDHLLIIHPIEYILNMHPIHLSLPLLSIIFHEAGTCTCYQVEKWLSGLWFIASDNILGYEHRESEWYIVCKAFVETHIGRVLRCLSLIKFLYNQAYWGSIQQPRVYHYRIYPSESKHFSH